jgi:GntR family transcriptional regulator/MocR family aminotransferase
MSSWQAEKVAATHGVDVVALDRYTLKQPDPKGVLLGFAAFDETSIRNGVLKLAAALDRKNPKGRGSR